MYLLTRFVCTIFTLLAFTAIWLWPLNAFANQITYESFLLKNGLQVVLVPNHKVPAVSHMIWYRVGAQDEVDGKTGLAHLLEHLMFKATDVLASGEFSSKVAKAGGVDNAFTHYDYTGYYQNIARNKLAMVMEMEANRMHNLILNEEQLNIEKLVVLEERRTRVDNNPLALLAEQMDKLLFSNHPYGRPIIGWYQDIEALSLADTQSFYQRYYAPNNAIVIVVGDITMQELAPLVKRYYGSLKPSVVPTRNIQRQITLPKSQHITRYDERIQKSQWVRFYAAPQHMQDCTKCYALTLFSYLLGESRTSLLYENLVVKEKIATAISSNYDDLSLGPATFSISAVPAPGITLETLEKAIDLQLAHALNQPFSNAQIERAKQALSAQVIYAQEDFSTLARIFGNLYVLGLDGSYVTHWKENMHHVTSEQMAESAMTVIQNKHAITGWLLPAESSQTEVSHATQ